MNFQVGDKVVYPNHGVAVIENISTRMFGARQERFYLLRLVSNRLTVLVPFSHAGDVGLRRVTRNGHLEQVLKFLAAGECPGCRDWKDRFKENSEKMQHGSLLEVAEVLKCLVVQQMQKPLSFREKRMLERARHMLVTEVSISRGLKEAEAEQMLSRSLAKSSLPWPEPL